MKKYVIVPLVCLMSGVIKAHPRDWSLEQQRQAVGIVAGTVGAASLFRHAANRTLAEDAPYRRAKVAGAGIAGALVGSVATAAAIDDKCLLPVALGVTGVAVLVHKKMPTKYEGRRTIAAAGGVTGVLASLLAMHTLGVNGPVSAGCGAAAGYFLGAGVALDLTRRSERAAAQQSVNQDGDLACEEVA